MVKPLKFYKRPTGRTLLGMKEYKIYDSYRRKAVNVIAVDRKQGIYMTLPQYKKYLKS